jgi:hypothetical protein
VQSGIPNCVEEVLIGRYLCYRIKSCRSIYFVALLRVGEKVKYIIVLVAFVVSASLTSYIMHSTRRARIGEDVRVQISEWKTVESPINIILDGNARLATTKGFWQPTESDVGKAFATPTAVEIFCTKSENTCTESRAIFASGIVEAKLFIYDIRRWTVAEVVAVGRESSFCGVGFMLTLDLRNERATITDFQEYVPAGKDCQPLQSTVSAMLRGGHLELGPAPPLWTPQAKTEDVK